MARAGILYSQVVKAAAALAAAGANPTVDTVRAALGTGSKSTIAPMLKQWKREHQGETAAAGAGLPADMLEAVKGVYQRLEAGAQEQVEQLRAAHEQARQEATQQLEAERAGGRQLRAEREALAAELAQVKAAFTHERDERQHAAVTIAALRAENDGLTQRLADRAAEVKLLADQLAQARQQFDYYQDKVAEQRQIDRQAAEARIAALERELGAVRSNLQEHREALAVLRGDKAHLENKVAELGEASKAQALQLHEATEALGAAREMANARQLETEIVGQRLDDAEHEIVCMEDKISALEKANAQLLKKADSPAPKPTHAERKSRSSELPANEE
ncbi:DNA-binding protein [Massilia sp. Root335]|uniref:DNA-binding protein n=1 Tax=Massilia sp. Root335 TaxID=1736517 RepID=UPI0006F8B43C|nr:DNA-binding protein [Massilia sp. Root335]KQV45115.1 hypothetical protein ASC93_00735 [Massilia sp. Root335]